MDGQYLISPQDLYAAVGTASAPTIFDVRRDAAFDADDRMLVSARRGPPEMSQSGSVIYRPAVRSSSIAVMAMR
jgi:hypothetical protein